MKKIISMLISAAVAVTAIPSVFVSESIEANAAASYPVQKFLMGISDTNHNVNVSGTRLKPDVQNGTDTEKWSLNFVSDNVFEIVSAESGNILTASGTEVTLSSDVDGADQRWKIDGVQKDFDGYYLYYKITNNVSGKALTYSENSGTFALSDYNGSSWQKYKINLEGCEGFAANSMCAEGEKACTIGGLFGQTVYANTDKELINYLNDTKPLTVVVNGTINMQPHQKTRIRDNKTIVGAYSGGKLIDCELRTNNEYGIEGDNPSDNIVFRNIDFLAKTERGRILIQIWSSRQIWIDHCTFNSELSRDKDEVGKFIWLNTPYETYMDKKDRLRSIDYITISYCQFRNRFWTVAYGTQNDEITRNRTTLMYNWWDQCVRRCPQLGNGNAHIYNNYYTGNDNGNDQSTDQIIGGDGCNIISQNCRFQSITKGHEIIGGGGNQPYRDDGSYYAEKSNSTPKPLNYKVSNTSNWHPDKSNYGYSLIDAYNTKGTDTKDFCLAYSGRFNSESKIKYITDSDMQKYVSAEYPSPFLKALSVNENIAAVMDTSVKYMFKNAGSGLYMEVDGAKAESGANVQQWGADGEAVHNTWKLKDAGDGYYYIRSCVGDGKTYFLDLSYGKADNGTNIGIWTNDESDARKFKFVDNGNGIYTILTKSSNDASCIAVDGDSTESGANIIQWQCNGKDSQKWIAEKITIKDGAVIDTTKNYMIQNVNSGQFMEVQDGKAESGANVQQWGADTSKPSAHNVWRLKEVNWGYYYIYSGTANGDTLLLNCTDGKDGTNIYIDEFLKSSTQYFKFVDNEDGTYTIVTRSSKDLSCVEVDNASVSSGANVQQWIWNDNNCQKWKLIPVKYTLPCQTTTSTAVTTTTTTTTTTTVTTTTSAATDPPKEVKGDVNADGSFSISDIVMMQKWLLAVPEAKLTDYKAADMYEDGVLNIFDLCYMKRELLK